MLFKIKIYCKNISWFFNKLQLGFICNKNYWIINIFIGYVYACYECFFRHTPLTCMSINLSVMIYQRMLTSLGKGEALPTPSHYIKNIYNLIYTNKQNNNTYLNPHINLMNFQWLSIRICVISEAPLVPSFLYVDTMIKT